MREGLIDYLGPQDDVRSALARCDVYVLPSFYREGVPRTILEAMSMGTPHHHHGQSGLPGNSRA